jgi:hypothetical protein
MLKKFLPLVCLPLLLAGCSTPFVVTNLNSLNQTRTTNNLYMVEVAVASNQQTLRWETIRPQIIAGGKSYEMHRTRLMNNRWEGLVPVAPGVNSVRYHYRFDFDYNSWGPAKSDSVVSSEYTLRVVGQ